MSVLGLDVSVTKPRTYSMNFVGMALTLKLKLLTVLPKRTIDIAVKATAKILNIVTIYILNSTYTDSYI